MKIAFLVVLTLHVILCTHIPLPDMKQERVHIPDVKKDQVAQTIVFLKENYNDTLIYTLLKSLYTNQAVLLLSGQYVSTNAVTNRLPNIIVLTKNLDFEDFNTEAYKSVLFSFWSLVYIVIITRDEKYVCINGKLSKDTFSEAEIYLNKLWHKYRIARAMMIFPYTCPDHYLIYDGKEVLAPGKYYNRQLKIIKPKSETDLVNVFVESGRNLTVDYPIRANIFNRFPTSIKECAVIDQYTKLNPINVSEFCGLDGMIMTDFFEYNKYDVIFSTDPNCDFYGYSDTLNNVTTGTLGCIVEKKIDISFNSRFLWQQTASRYFFLYFVAQDSLCPVMKTPLSIPLWKYVTNGFSPEYLLVPIVLIFLGFVTWLSASVSSKFTNEKPLKLYSYLLNSLSSALFGIMLQNHRNFLLLKGTSLVCSIVFLAIYQGHVNYQFTTSSHYCEIKTLEQLLESSAVLITSPSIMDILKPTLSRNSAFMNRVLFSNISNDQNLDKIIENPQMITVSRGKDVMIEVFRDYNDNKTNIPKIYVIDECFQNFYLSYIASSDFLFVEDSTKFMMHMIESGLPNQYYTWTRRAYNLADRFPNIGSAPRPYQPIDLSTLRSPFAFLLIGYFASGVVFAVEKIRGGRLKFK